MNLSLGFSPCPNDTFIFDALIHGRVTAPGLTFDARLADVETLNRLAQGGVLDVTKVSYGALPYLLGEYVLVRSGGALGRGCGPLLLARRSVAVESLRHGTIAIPGRLTTANLLLRLFDPELPEGEERVYSEIMPAVASGEVDAGLVIHESRFTYPEHGLVSLVDLGQWWEHETAAPIPLGAIVARRSLGADGIIRIEDAIRRSVEHAFAHPEASRPYVMANSQEMSRDVAAQHIALYVNDFSIDLGGEGTRAVLELLRRAASMGLAPDVGEDALTSI